MYLEEVLLCWQAHRSGRPVLLAREARCLHALGGSAGGDNFHSSLGLYLTLLGARVAFIRSTSGPTLAAATRATMAFGALLRLCRGDARYKRRQLAVLWWAVTSGQAPPWRDGPCPNLPRRLSIAG
jgi:GT2 family glycosyltransferase